MSGSKQLFMDWYKKRTDNEIHSLYIDDENNLWIGTANGLQRYLPEKDSFQTVTLHTIKAKGRITGIFQRNTGEILCNVSDVGIFSVDIQTMVAHPVITESKLFHPPFVTCLFEDSRRQLWLGTDRQGIYGYRTNCFLVGSRKRQACAVSLFRKKEEYPFPFCCNHC